MEMRMLLTLLLVGAVFLAGSAQAGQLLFKKKLYGNSLTTMLHPTGIIIVVSETTISGFDPETGDKKWAKVWKRKTIELEYYHYSDNIKLVPGSPYLIYRENWASVRCLDIITGEEVWKIDVKKDVPAMLEKLRGEKPKAKIVGGLEISSIAIDDARRQFLIGPFTISVKEDRPTLKLGIAAIDMGTGKANFVYVLPEDASAYGAPAEDYRDYYNYIRSYASEPAQVIGDLVVLDWGGIHTFKAADGTPVASLKIDRTPLAPDTTGSEFLFELPAAPTLVDGHTAYVVAWKKLVAVDLQTGAVKWENEEVCPVMPELRVAGEKLLVRTGAPYLPGETIEKQKAEEKKAAPKLSSKQKKILKAGRTAIKLSSKLSDEKTAEDPLRGTFEDTTLIKYFTPCGLTILDKNTGEILADTEKMGGTGLPALMTPLLIDGNTVYFGAGNTLQAIDLDRLAYRFIAKVDSATKEDVPKQVLLEDGKLYLLLSQTTAAFDPADGEFLWSYTVPAMKLDPLARLDLAAEHAFEQFSVLQDLLAARRYNPRLAAYARIMESRFAAAQKSGMYNYSLAYIERAGAGSLKGAETYKLLGKVPGMKVVGDAGSIVEDAMALEIEVVGVSLRTGTPERRYRGVTDEKEYHVDPFIGTIVTIWPPDRDELLISSMAAGD